MVISGKEPSKTVYFRLPLRLVDKLTRVALADGNPIATKWIRKIVLRELKKHSPSGKLKEHE